MEFLRFLIPLFTLVAANGIASTNEAATVDTAVAEGGESMGEVAVEGRTGGNKRFFDDGLGGFGGGFGQGVGIGGGIGPVGGFGAGGLGGLGGSFGGVNSAFGGGFGGIAPPSTCRYWCRTPQGQAYCCESADEPQSFVGVLKPGFCPPVRPVCPPVRNFLPPATCSNDGACGGIDKCCFDTCLQEHICKPPLGIGR